MVLEHSIVPAKSLKQERMSDVPEEEYEAKLEQELTVAIEKIISEHPLLGEGKAGKVFDFLSLIIGIPACIKIWHPELEELKNKDVVAYRRIQYLSPEEEFALQEKLYENGFHNTPRPLAYGRYGKYYFILMESISGYTLKELVAAKAKIKNINWKELEQLLIKLNRQYGVAHRDLHAGNIMLETKDQLSLNAKLEGRLVIIDFGLSKSIGTMPTKEDYILTMGKNSILYRDDRVILEELSPRQPDSPFQE